MSNIEELKDAYDKAKAEYEASLDHYVTTYDAWHKGDASCDEAVNQARRVYEEVVAQASQRKEELQQAFYEASERSDQLEKVLDSAYDAYFLLSGD